MQQVVARLPWGHNVRLLEAVKDPAEREWYARQAIENGWSRNVLAHQIESGLYGRQGKALTNFARTLPAAAVGPRPADRQGPLQLRLPLARRRTCSSATWSAACSSTCAQLILELGKGFAFVGSQYHLEVGGEDFYLDLLFYHLRLRCFVVIDLKIEEFKPEFAGKMNFYLSAVDDLLRHPDDGPSIGIILCQGRERGRRRVRAPRHQQADGRGAVPALAGAARSSSGASCRLLRSWRASSR